MSTAAEMGPWVPTDATFGARLALIRQHKQWGNVQEAALACGVPVASWRNWERDGRLPRDLMTVTAKIAAATGVDQAWLAGFPTPPRGSTVIACSSISAGQRAVRIATGDMFDDLVRAA